MDITFKYLVGSELDQLDSIFKLRGWTPLNKELSSAIAAYDGDKLIGFHVLQFVAHVEPMYLDKQYRGQGITNILAKRMVETLLEAGVRSYVAIADDPAAAVLCEQSGMKKITSPVFVK